MHVLLLPWLLTVGFAPQQESTETLFREIDFFDALDAAEEEHKIVALVWTRADHAESRLLLESVRGPQVSAWLGELAVALHLDADRDARLARELYVGTFPATLFLRSDATEIGRVPGHHAPEVFRVRAQAVIAGRRTGEAVERPQLDEAADPHAWLAYANYVVSRGEQLDQALPAYLWCLDHGDTYLPGFRAAYLDYLLENIKNLANQVAGAQPALRERRDSLASALLAGQGTTGSARELARFNYWLREVGHTTEVWDELDEADPAQARARGELFGHVLAHLVAYRRYVDVAKAAGERLKELRSELETFRGSAPEGDAAEESAGPELDARSQLVDEASLLYEALLGAGRGKDAFELERLVTEIFPTGRVYKLFMEKALRVDLPAVARRLGTSGLEQVSNERGKRAIQSVLEQIPPEQDGE